MSIIAAFEYTDPMTTRAHIHEESFPASPEQLFTILHTPSAIRGWWNATRAIVIPELGGTWAAAWGDDEDNPDYITTATIDAFDPPRILSLTNFQYRSKDGDLPFHAEFTTTFDITPTKEGATLRVTQDGFPSDPEADEFYASCDTGWRETFKNIRAYLQQQNR